MLEPFAVDRLPPGGTGSSSQLFPANGGNGQAVMPVVGCVFAAVQEHLCEGSMGYTPAMVLPVLLRVETHGSI
jgi:hypothetical protein